ncbi:protocadherin Fat 4-like [Argopecten irradians]|uniref:protocadherin Fat 4-like n=1 Tax=Argopecten irradians TaxID=31199 RepID=UPI003716E7B5
MEAGVFLYLLCLTIVNKASSQSCGTKTVGEAAPVSYQDNLDTTLTGIGYIATDTKYTFDCCGLITQWHTVIGALGTIRFQIWRPNGALYELVGENIFTFNTADQLAEQTLTVSAGSQITVMANDVIGWYLSGNDMISYNGGAGEASGNKQLSMAAPSVGSSVNWGGAASLNLRTYGINAQTTANSVPTFTNLDQTLTYLDTDTPPTTLLTLTFSDADPQDTVLTVAMTTTSTEFQFSSTTYQVQPQTGQWTVGTYPLSFTVTDQCGNEGTGTLTVEITNTAPDVTAMVTADSIREDVTVQTHMTDFTVTDVQSYTCTYTGSAPFNVQPRSSGSTTYALFLNGGANLNYDTQNQYTLTITCTDDLGLSSTKDIVVSIVESAAPSMTNLPNTGTVDTLTTPATTEIFAITGVDSDSTNLVYTMTCVPVNCPFQILSSGQIIATEDLNTHKVPAYDVNVWVNDGYSLVGPETLSLTLTNINAIPVISNIPVGLTLTIPENSPVTTTVLDTAATDGNTGDTHTFSAVFSPGDGANYFEIISGTGVIKPTQVIDYEELLAKGTTSFNVAVTANDKREDSVTKYFTLEVTDVNEQQTGFTQTTYQISGLETTTTFNDLSPTLAASVIDPDDTRDTQTLTMDCGANTGQFSMDASTGRVTKAAEYDLDATQQTSDTVTCVVTATDLGGHTVTADLNIVINEENDNPPVLDQDTYTHFLPINTGAGTQFGPFSSTDADVLTAHTDTTYSLSGGSGLFGLIDCCSVFNNVNFSTTTYNVGDSFTMTLTALNNNGLTDTATVNVILTDPVTTTTAATTTTSTTAATAASVAFPNFGGSGGSISNFLDDPENLGWFIPSILLFAAMLALLGYMVYRCIRNPGAFAKLRNLCKGRSLNCKWPERSKMATRTKKPKKLKSKPRKCKETRVRQLGNNDGKYEWNTWSHADFGNKAVEHR